MFELGDLLNDLFLERLNYLIYVVLLMIGLHAMIAKNNLIKKLIGMSIFQTAIILFYVSIGVKTDATIPIYLPEHVPHGEQHDPDVEHGMPPLNGRSFTQSRLPVMPIRFPTFSC